MHVLPYYVSYNLLRVIKTCLAIWHRSKNAYRVLEEPGFIKLPSKRLLQYHKSKIKQVIYFQNCIYIYILKINLRSNSLRSTERKLFSISMLIFMTNKLYKNIWLVAHAIQTVFLFIFFFPQKNILHTLVITTILNYSIFLSVLLHRPKYTYLSHYSFSIDHEF